MKLTIKSDLVSTTPRIIRNEKKMESIQKGGLNNDCRKKMY